MSENNNSNFTLGFTSPSTTPGAVVDIKQNRAIISLTEKDLSFLANFLTLVNITGISAAGSTATPPGTVVPTNAEGAAN